MARPADKRESAPRNNLEAKRQFELMLAASRILILIPVVVLLVAALGTFVYGTGLFVSTIHDVVSRPLPPSHKIGELLIVVDLFLIGATLIIASVGFYELFINRIDTKGAGQLPGWLQMRDLNDLKARVIAMIILIAAVDFIQVLVGTNDGRQILERGTGTALVIVALTVFMRFSSQTHEDGS